MKQYFDVYIRRTATPIDFTDLQGNDNVLDDWDRLEYPELKAGIKIVPQTVDLGDGTQGVDGEKVEIESGTFRTDATELAWLKSEFDNRLCDVLFYNPSIRTVVAVAYGVKVSVSHMVTSGESRVIKLVGARNLAVGSSDNGAVAIMVLLADQKPILSTGTVYASDGVTPVADVVVAAQLESTLYEDHTDKDGNYLILAHNFLSDLTLSATKSGSTWEAIDPEVVTNADNVVNFVAREA